MPYAYDPTGVSAANLVTEEIHLLPTAGQYGNHRSVIPVNAPYFADSMQVSIIGNGGSRTLLTRGQKWLPGHLFGSATRSLDKFVYGSFSIIDPTLQGNIVISYQTLGGNWVLNGSKITSILANLNYLPTAMAWEQVTNYPDSFPVGPHSHVGTDFGEYQEVIDAINNVADVIAARPVGVSTADLNAAVTALNASLALLNNKFPQEHTAIMQEVNAAIQAAIAALNAAGQGDISALNTRVTSLENGAVTTNNNVATNTSNISAINTAISNLQSSVSAIIAVNTSQSSSISAVQTLATNLQVAVGFVQLSASASITDPYVKHVIVLANNISVQYGLSGLVANFTVSKAPDVTSFTLTTAFPGLQFKVLDQNTGAVLTDSSLLVDHNGSIRVIRPNGLSYAYVEVIT